MSSPAPSSIERFAEVGAVTLCYETFGREGDPPMLLIMGLGAQMIIWPDDFCHMLAERGFYVIRFDNRDIGRSSRIDAPPPNVMAAFQGKPIKPPYLLTDMADDAVGLLTALGIEKAHIVGASMGGMIAQLIAIHHPDRVLTLTSIMSTTGDPSLPPPSPAMFSIFVAPPPTTIAEYVEANVRAWDLMRGGAFPEEREIDRERAMRAAARGFDPLGNARQLGAIVVAGNRKDLLAQVNAPTLVIHGAIDPLVPLAGGQATAAAIPGAKLIVLPEMGHSLPRKLLPEIVEAIATHAN